MGQSDGPQRANEERPQRAHCARAESACRLVVGSIMKRSVDENFLCEPILCRIAEAPRKTGL